MSGMTFAREHPREGQDAATRPGVDGEDGDAPATPSERIHRVLEAYHQAFDAGDPKEATPYVHRPCTVVTRWGAYVLTDRQEIESALTSVQRDLRARGCERTDRRDVHVRLLDDRLARARALAVRFDDADRVVERTGTAYVLRRTEQGWRIAVLVEHEAGEAADPG